MTTFSMGVPAHRENVACCFEFIALAPLGERVDRNRRFHQPGRAG
jgi:hypothetical protein